MTPLETFIRPATARSGFWRPIIGVLLIGAIWALGTTAAILIYAALAIESLPGEAFTDARIDAFAAQSSPTAFMFSLASFVTVWIALWGVGRFLHGQPFATFFTPDRRLHTGLLVKGLVFSAFFMLLTAAIGLQITDGIRPQLDLAQVAILFLPITVLVFVQATAEELVFRGYLLQQLAMRSRHWLVWAFLPSLAFAWLHHDPQLSFGNYWAAGAFLYGLLACALVWRSGTLWPAVGLHVGTNIVAFTVLGVEGIFAGTQLWVVDADQSVPVFQVDLAMVGLMLIIVLSPAGRIFGPGSKGSTASDPS